MHEVQEVLHTTAALRQLCARRMDEAASLALAGGQQLTLLPSLREAEEYLRRELDQVSRLVMRLEEAPFAPIGRQ